MINAWEGLFAALIEARRIEGSGVPLVVTMDKKMADSLGLDVSVHRCAGCGDDCLCADAEDCERCMKCQMEARANG